MTTNGYRASFWVDENVPKLVLMVAKPCEFIKNHLIVYF